MLGTEHISTIAAALPPTHLMESPRSWSAVIGAANSNRSSFADSMISEQAAPSSKQSQSLPSLAYVFGRSGHNDGRPRLAPSALPTPPGSGEFEKENFDSRDSGRDSRDADDHFPLFPPLPGQGSGFATIHPRQQSSPRIAPSPSLRYLPPPENQPNAKTFSTYVRNYVKEHEWHYETSRPSRNDYRLALECLQESRKLPPLQPRVFERDVSVITDSDPSWTDYEPLESPETSPRQEVRYAPYDSPVRTQYETDGIPPHITRRKQASSAARSPSDGGTYEPAISSKRQRSAKSSRRTMSGSSASAMKQSKHSRSGATKVRRSREPDDYPSDICPALEMGHHVTEEANRIARKDVNHPKDIGVDDFKRDLHEAEVNVAAKLNLVCKEYLCVKRQIFEAFLTTLKNPVGKKWNKTAAQEATNVDVTKVSSIFEFYNNIGFFEESLYKERMERPVRQDT